MIRPSNASATAIQVWTHTPATLSTRLPQIHRFIHQRSPIVPLSHQPEWLPVLHDSLGHDVVGLEAQLAGHTCGFLPLARVESWLFGRYLVSLPYLNSNGVLADSHEVRQRLITRAAELADEWEVKHLELRQEVQIDHPKLTQQLTTKVHMRKKLPAKVDLLWKGYDTKVRNQVRKGEKSELRVAWGGFDLLDHFYNVLCHNMRDLGTPVYGRVLFEHILDRFQEEAELIVIYAGQQAIAGGLLLHGQGITEIPTASSLREFNHTCANMLMYHHVQARSVERAQQQFDFGRSTVDGATFKFKKQWGASPEPAIWQYYSRHGSIRAMRPDNPKYGRMIRLWQRLPVSISRLVGPPIIRGIP